MLGPTEALSTDSAVVGLAVHVVDQVITVARRADNTFCQRVIFHVDHKMLGLTEALSTDSAVVWLAVHVGDEVHS